MTTRIGHYLATLLLLTVGLVASSALAAAIFWGSTSAWSWVFALSITAAIIHVGTYKLGAPR